MPRPEKTSVVILPEVREKTREIKKQGGRGLSAQLEFPILYPVEYASEILTALDLPDELYIELVKVLGKIKLELKGKD